MSIVLASYIVEKTADHKCGFFRTDILLSSVEKRLLIASNLLLLGENAKQKNGNCNNLPGILFFKSRYI
jgi:hypothetical protein